jgi:ubiquinone/menaquinone biosynthesis C-methylase UbiE|tara:strand:+ start:273 stop:887 length:615 start_codon:yes stop_codon:yes gene_type:complete
LIKRTSINYINKLLSDHPNWKILDIGCGYNADTKASVISDIKDLSKYYPGKNFIKITDKNLPFKDKEFDFVISSHVLEHVEDISYFINELERISSKGYIEFPTKLEDNLVFENKNDHKWHLEFDDVENKLIISNRLQIFEPILTVSSIKLLNKFFRESLVFELFWEESINYIIENKKFHNSEKISHLKLLKKYFSKKIRKFFSK